MSSFWTVEPEFDVVPLKYRGRDFTLSLKRELTTGEEKMIHSSAFRSLSQGEGKTDADMELNINFGGAIFTKVKVYIADWSLKDDKERKLPITIETIKAMRPALFKLLEKAVDEHAAKLVAEAAEEEKKFQELENGSQKISA